MATSMTSAAWERGFMNALICATGAAVVWAASTALIAAIFTRGFLASALVSYILLFGLVTITFYASWIRQIFTRGPLLLDCGPHPGRIIFVANTVIFLAVGVGGYGHYYSPLGVLSPICALITAAFSASMILGRLQLRENGIWQYYGLLKWEKVRSYEWLDGTGCTLLVRAKSVLPFMGRGALPVPPESKSAIDELLREHCPSRGHD